MTAESRAAAVLAAHQTHGDHLAGWTFVCACGFKTNFVGAHRTRVAQALAAAGLLLADDGQATGEPDGLRAAVKALADDFDSNIDWSAGRNTYGDNEAWESAARLLRAALAANPPTSGSETDRG